MPIGSYAAVPSLAQAVLQLQPRSVLDLGVGFGGGGAAVREWLDLGVRPWKTYLVGVESWGDYRNPVWDLYDVVYVRTIEEFFRENHERFDCVLFTDVLEHFEKGAGRRVLADMQTRVAPGGCLLVTTPASFFPQDAVYGNERERHCSYWSESDLTQLGFQVERLGRPDFYCGECWFAQWRR